MIKRIIIVAILFVMLTDNLVNAQTFNVQSFDGTTQLIHVLSGEHSPLTISCSNDTLRVSEFDGFADKIAVLNKTFLKIDYRRRAGSGLELVRSLILCVYKNHLVESLHITTLLHEEFIDFRKPMVDTANMVDMKSTSALALDLAGTNNQNFKLTVKIHDERWAKHHYGKNYNHRSQAILNFDPGRNIFYNAHQEISRYFTVYDPKTRKEAKRHLKGTFPLVKLATYAYYYAKDEWYEKDDGDELSAYSYR